MSKWSKSEIESAFTDYRSAADHGAETDDWTPFSEKFTPDCVYLEHLIGRMNGRKEVFDFYTRSMVKIGRASCRERV